MSSASTSHVLVGHSYAMDGHLPSKGEIILVCPSQNLFGPGSTGIIGSVPSRSTRHNYHNAVVLDIKLSDVFESLVSFTVCLMLAYSLTDPESGLFSTRWLLNQADDYQQQHIPVAFAALKRRSVTLDSCSDDDCGDDEEVWEDNMDPITFCRHYAAGNPALAKEHDKKMRDRLDQGIKNWKEFNLRHPEWGAS